MRLDVDEAKQRRCGGRRVRSILLLPLIVVLVLVAGGCGGDDEEGRRAGGVAASGTGAPETTQITFGIIPTPDYAPVRIAIDKGFFREEGLDVKTQDMGPGGAVPGVVGGSLDVAGI